MANSDAATRHANSEIFHRVLSKLSTRWHFRPWYKGATHLLFPLSTY
jgi:hypothetical protein